MTEPSAPDNSPNDEPYGFRDGFGAYETVNKSDYIEQLSSGLVIFDTNALLNLYRYTPQARADFFNAMKSVKLRTWIPHQVIEEFWRNRESAITDFDAASSQATTAFQKAYESQIEALNRWSKRVSLSHTHKSSLEATLKNAVDQVAREMQSLRDIDHNTSHNTTTDPVLTELDSLLAGRVGPPLNPAEHKAAILEAKRRIFDRVPPGFEDAKKPDDHQPGDYILWEQILVKVSLEKVDAAIITGDTKADWWRLDSKKNPKGPRVELYEEMRRRTGARLRMLTPQHFLDLAKDIFDLPVQPESLADVQEVNEPNLGDLLGGLFSRNSKEKVHRALKETYRNYLRKNDFAVAAVGGRNMADLHARRDPDGHLYEIHILTTTTDDQDEADGLRHLLQDTVPDSKNTTQVVVFPSIPSAAEAEITLRANALVVWRTVNSFQGSPAAADASLAD